MSPKWSLLDKKKLKHKFLEKSGERLIAKSMEQESYL